VFPNLFQSSSSYLILGSAKMESNFERKEKEGNRKKQRQVKEGRRFEFR